MGTGRSGHTVTLLPNGKALVAGGYFTNSLSNAELYDPATGTWTLTGSMASARRGHTATLLPNGHVLVAEDTAELYDSATGAWAPAAPLNTGRSSHTATLLADGLVLVAGGISVTFPLNAELYNPKSGPASQSPILKEAKILANGSFQFAFTNTPGAVFSVLTATNPSLPIVNWTVLAGLIEVSPGQFQFTDSQATNHPQRLYRLRSP
jgi:hypothetical protein